MMSAACTTSYHPHPIFPEQDMYETWFRTHINMRNNSSILLQVNEYLVKGDTLAAQQLLAGRQLVLRGMEHPLDSVGTQWVVFGSGSRDTAFTMACTAPDELTYRVRCTEQSKYNTDQDHYGCGTHYEIRLMHIDPGTYRANGGGYIDTDGSADLLFDEQDLHIGGKPGGNLTLTAYAHRYDSTVVYHYTFYDQIVVCDETKREVGRN